MAISEIDFGKNLRPSTVEAINKINEIIATVNELDPDNISEIQSNVSTLQTQMSTAQTQISSLTENVSTATATIESHTTDIDNIKVTLYTPLDSEEEE